MDIHCKTLHIFKNFLDDLIKVFPEYKDNIILNYSDFLTCDPNNSKLESIEKQKLEKFLTIVDNISDNITERDETIFSEELFLLEDICFKKIWESDISMKTKDNIWKYLQSFCLININIRSNDKLLKAMDDIEENKKIDKKVAKDLDNYKKINEDFSSENIDNSVNNKEDIHGFENILENTAMGKIAKEITDEMDIENMAQGGDISQIFNPQNITKIFTSINNKLTNNENFSQEHLQSEAQDICGNMKDNPLFSQMMGGLFGSMQMPQAPQQPQPQQTNTRNINVDSSHDPNNTKKRLQKKLDKKIKIEKLDKK